MIFRKIFSKKLEVIKKLLQKLIFRRNFRNTVSLPSNALQEDTYSYISSKIQNRIRIQIQHYLKSRIRIRKTSFWVHNTT